MPIRIWYEWYDMNDNDNDKDDLYCRDNDNGDDGNYDNEY